MASLTMIKINRNENDSALCLCIFFPILLLIAYFALVLAVQVSIMSGQAEQYIWTVYVERIN